MARSRKRKSTGETTQLFRPSKPQKIKKRRFWPYFFLVILISVAGYYFWDEFFEPPSMPPQLTRPGMSLMGDDDKIVNTKPKESLPGKQIKDKTPDKIEDKMQIREQKVQPEKKGPSQTLKDIPTTIQRNIQVEILNGCGVQGMAAKFAQILRKRDIDVVSTGNYKSLDVNNTQIIDRIGNRDFAAQVAKILDVKRKFVYTQVNKKLLIDATIIIGKDYKQLKMK